MQRQIYVVVHGAIMVLLVFWHIYSTCRRRVFLKLRSVYPWGFAHVFLKVWKPSEIIVECYLSILMTLLKIYAWSGSRGWLPYNRGLLLEFSSHIQRDGLKGQHLTFGVLTSTFGFRLAQTERLSPSWGWQGEGPQVLAPGASLASSLAACPLPHQPPYCRRAPLRPFLLLFSLPRRFFPQISAWIIPSSPSGPCLSD